MNTLLKSCSENIVSNGSLFFRGFAQLLSTGEVEARKTKKLKIKILVFRTPTFPGLSSSGNPLKNTEPVKSTFLEQLFKNVLIDPAITRKVIAWQRNVLL